MTEYVNVRLDSIMDDESDHITGRKVKGLTYHLEEIKRQNEIIINLLRLLVNK